MGRAPPAAPAARRTPRAERRTPNGRRAPTPRA
ncbi:hypothetical protein GSH08_00820 [Burkholderia pseudomallei]|nr:hypothetical protein F5D26_18435 [Burkholderia pseudomallei]MBM5576017.1 hypothetical protein [Burkholderia pseudomallei]MBM5584113.1 hypothetical protein [Burkholderia pseudomallei]RPA02188.1 hypothetical protein EGT86_24420 [Burkholderia pseudomallei]